LLFGWEVKGSFGSKLHDEKINRLVMTTNEVLIYNEFWLKGKYKVNQHLLQKQSIIDTKKGGLPPPLVLRLM